MVARTLPNQSGIDVRKGDASLGTLRSSLNNWDNAIHLQPNAQTGGTLDETRALARRFDLCARPPTLGNRNSRSPQSHHKVTGDPEFERAQYRAPGAGTG